MHSFLKQTKRATCNIWHSFSFQKKASHEESQSSYTPDGLLGKDDYDVDDDKEKGKVKSWFLGGVGESFNFIWITFMI